MSELLERRRLARAEAEISNLEALLLEIAEAQRGARSYGGGDKCDCPDKRTKKELKNGKGKSCSGHETKVQALVREAGFWPLPPGGVSQGRWSPTGLLDL